MSLKDNLLNFINGSDNEAAINAENTLPGHAPLYLLEGLCTDCNNRPHCVWVENSKIYCEHYE